MSRRIWPSVLAIAACALAALPAGGQVDPMATGSDRGLPFSTLPDRLPGPPRAPGQLPEGRSQPPSTLPGRMPGPPRASGMSPPSAETLPRDRLGPLLLPPGTSPALPPSPGLGGPFLQDLSPPSELDMFGSPGPLPPIEEGELPPEEILREIEPLVLPPSEPLHALATPLLPRPPRLAEPPTAPPLSLGEVLASSERSYPPFLESIQSRGIAAGEWLRTLGVFDLRINADARNYPMGYYQRFLYDVFVEQYTPHWGTTYFAGYRLARGRWPTYYQYLDTLPSGAYIAGFEVPLLKNGRIDARRALVLQAEIERMRVEPEISRERIGLFRDAARAYWAWVAAGHQYLVYEQLLKIAEMRNVGIQRQVELGLASPLVLVDNQRVVLQRQALLLDAQRRFLRAGLELSLYLRDRYCLPVIPPTDRLPPQFPAGTPPTTEMLPELIETALRLRPEIREVRLEGQRVGVEWDLARNQLLPELNLYVYAEQNAGPLPATPDDATLSQRVVYEQRRAKAPFILESSLLFEVPLQRRAARGRLQAAEAQVRQIRLRERFMTDRIAVDVQDAVGALRAYSLQVERNRMAVEANRKLEVAERRRFDLGLSTVLVVALREQATADAQAQYIESMARFFDTLADYRAALGVDALPPIPTPGADPRSPRADRPGYGPPPASAMSPRGAAVR